MDKDFYENWGSLRKITEKFHVVKSHDSHSNQMCGENKRVKRKSFSDIKNYATSLSLDS